VEILKICHESQPDGQRASKFTIFCTQVLGLRVNILINVTAYPAILSCARSQIVKTSPIGKKRMLGGSTKKNQRLSIYPRVTGDMPTKRRKEHCLQQTRLQYSTSKNGMVFYKNECISARWSTSLDAHHIPHTDT